MAKSEIELRDFQRYVNGTESERLDYERRTMDNPGDGYEHKRCYQPWPSDVARRERSIAMRLLFEHDHPLNDRSQLTRENCGACVLNGYEPRGGYEEGRRVKHDGPNYSGWARVYIQAGRPIPANWHAAFARQGTAADSADGTENRAYYDALGRDLVTWGAHFVEAGE